VSNLEGELQAALRAAVAAGAVLLSHYDESVVAAHKESLRDIVTNVDLEAERTVLDMLHDLAPEVPATAEESVRLDDESSARRWIVDALDGTVNYVNKVPFFCVSIGLVDSGEALVGVVHAPMADDLYYAARGLGVFKNQVRLAAPDQQPEEGLFAAAFAGKAFEPDRRGEEFLLLGKVNDESRGCLRTGSAAMNLAYVAEGRLAGCWGKANKLWDVAAGLLIAEMAGATVASTRVNQEPPLVSYIASAPSCAAYLRDRGKDVLGLD
jgi:myo-inositol-1(or 4)-monophosphatase